MIHSLIMYVIYGFVTANKPAAAKLSNVKAPRQVHDPARIDLVSDSPQTCSVARSVKLFRLGSCNRIIRVCRKGVLVDALRPSDLLERCHRLAYPSIPPVVFG